MSDDAKIEPALSAEEWASVASVKTGREFSRIGTIAEPGYAQPRPGLSYGWPWAGINVHAEYSNAGLDTSWTPAVMAYANAVLPNGHPLKLTRADVDGLMKLVEELAEGNYDLNDMDEGRISFVRTLTAKIAALLPPE